ncbi:external alternative NAD(P)H-ubiquinone oxidoreductase B1, mitochondrial isoform X2 [Coffea arabica]|uniref:NADH:ubiquinone reductase (non-electrogenic) n=1 Tax=Coffea arabica TaxID=13443 RepID=A0ABM4UIE0_COFAR
MRVLSYLQRAFHGRPYASKLLILCSISSGGLIAYADSQPDGKMSIVDHGNKKSQKKRVVVLGTGWAATSFLKDLDISSYDVQVVSPRNYFAFTPLLPSVTCGTVEARSIVEPVRNMIKKEVEDAQRIRRTVIDCFEKAVLPGLTDEERKTNLHFVIVGGGPTGVEFAAELHDFVFEDLVNIYPGVKDLVKITVIQSGDHILNTFDERISTFAEQKFSRDGIEVLTGRRVVSVSDRIVNMKMKSNGEDISMPHGMVVWSTGVGSRPVVKDFMEQIGQGSRRVLATDEWLRVKGCEYVYALGDCTHLQQKKIKEDISEIFKAADKDNNGSLTIEEFREVIEDIIIRYPQVELYLQSKHLFDVVDLFKDAEGNDREEIDIEAFKLALSHVDTQMKSLPATAQVASQQGAYLARCFNLSEKCKRNPEGPRRFRSGGRHEFRPFRYKHFGQFAPLGGEQAAAELPGDWVSMGRSTQWLWYSVYASKQVSWRTRLLVVGDWSRRFLFGRDSSRI